LVHFPHTTLVYCRTRLPHFTSPHTRTTHALLVRAFSHFYPSPLPHRRYAHTYCLHFTPHTCLPTPVLVCFAPTATAHTTHTHHTPHTTYLLVLFTLHDRCRTCFIFTRFRVCAAAAATCATALRPPRFSRAFTRTYAPRLRGFCTLPGLRTALPHTVRMRTRLPHTTAACTRCHRRFTLPHALPHFWVHTGFATAHAHTVTTVTTAATTHTRVLPVAFAFQDAARFGLRFTTHTFCATTTLHTHTARTLHAFGLRFTARTRTTVWFPPHRFSRFGLPFWFGLRTFYRTRTLHTLHGLHCTHTATLCGWLVTWFGCVCKHATHTCTTLLHCPSPFYAFTCCSRALTLPAFTVTHFYLWFGTRFTQVAFYLHTPTHRFAHTPHTHAQVYCHGTGLPTVCGWFTGLHTRFARTVPHTVHCGCVYARLLRTRTVLHTHRTAHGFTTRTVGLHTAPRVWFTHPHTVATVTTPHTFVWFAVSHAPTTFYLHHGSHTFTVGLLLPLWVQFTQFGSVYTWLLVWTFGLVGHYTHTHTHTLHTPSTHWVCHAPVLPCLVTALRTFTDLPHTYTHTQFATHTHAHHTVVYTPTHTFPTTGCTLGWLSGLVYHGYTPHILHTHTHPLHTHTLGPGFTHTHTHTVYYRTLPHTQVFPHTLATTVLPRFRFPPYPHTTHPTFGSKDFSLPHLPTQQLVGWQLRLLRGLRLHTPWFSSTHTGSPHTPHTQVGHWLRTRLHVGLAVVRLRFNGCWLQVWLLRCTVGLYSLRFDSHTVQLVRLPLVRLHWLHTPTRLVTHGLRSRWLVTVGWLKIPFAGWFYTQVTFGSHTVWLPRFFPHTFTPWLHTQLVGLHLFGYTFTHLLACELFTVICLLRHTLRRFTVAFTTVRSWLKA